MKKKTFITIYKNLLNCWGSKSDEIWYKQTAKEKRKSREIKYEINSKQREQRQTCNFVFVFFFKCLQFAHSVHSWIFLYEFETVSNVFKMGLCVWVERKETQTNGNLKHFATLRRKYGFLEANYLAQMHIRFTHKFTRITLHAKHLNGNELARIFHIWNAVIAL